MTDAEVFACVKLIRGTRHSAPDGVPFASWAFGNLRLTDANEFLPKLDVTSRRERGSAVRLDVLANGVLLEHWKIIPGTCTSDATSLSLLARSMFFFMRFSELHAELAHRSDVEVLIADRASLPDGPGHKMVWSAGLDGLTVQVTTNEGWRSAIFDRARPKSTTPTPSNDSLPGSLGVVRPTPPLAPQANVVGSFGTSPRVGQASVMGAFSMPTIASTVVKSPQRHPTRPVPVQEDLPPLVPVSAAADVASPTSDPTARRGGLPFGIGTSAFELDDTDGSPASHDRGQFPSLEESHRRDVTAFLSVVSEFYARPKGVPAAVSVRDAADAVADA